MKRTSPPRPALISIRSMAGISCASATRARPPKYMKRWIGLVAGSNAEHKSELELHVQFDHLVRLRLRGIDPFAHRRHRNYGRAIGGAITIELHVIAHEAGHDRREHSVRHARRAAEQEGAFVDGETFAPDIDDTVDVGARACPDFETGMVSFQVHRQSGTQIREAGMHFT